MPNPSIETLPLTPARQHVAIVLRGERDDLHRELVRDCEHLLEHDARVKVAAKELERVTAARDAAKLRLDAMRQKIEGVESAYRDLTGFDMPRHSLLQ